MKTYLLPITISGAALLSILLLAGAGTPPPETEFAYAADGQVKFPADYRQWVFLSSGLGMTYGPIGATGRMGPPMFDNAFVSRVPQDGSLAGQDYVRPRSEDFGKPCIDQ
jgi:hypothetical protein